LKSTRGTISDKGSRVQIPPSRLNKGVSKVISRLSFLKQGCPAIERRNPEIANHSLRTLSGPCVTIGRFTKEHEDYSRKVITTRTID
jgi:hypothetical protein